VAKSPKALGRTGVVRTFAAVPVVISRVRSEVINFRVASSVVDQLDAAADAAGTTRKVIITRALAKAGFRIPQPDLEDRTPRRRRRVA
jgi:hypothetical protein